MRNILLVVGAVLLVLAAVFFFTKIMGEAVMIFLILGVLAVVASMFTRG